MVLYLVFPNLYDEHLRDTISAIFREYRQRKSWYIWPLLYWPLARMLTSDQMTELLHAPKNSQRMAPIMYLLLKREPFFRSTFPKNIRLPLLWITILGGHEKTAELLIKSGADVNERSKIKLEHHVAKNATVLHLLLLMYPSSRNKRMIRKVLDHGADVRAQDSNKRSVLHYAVYWDRIELTKMLLARGTDINAVDCDGKTPLFEAVRSSWDNELPTLLIKLGADVFVRDNNGRNLLHEITFANEERVDLARSFIEKGVRLDERETGTLFQPLHWAVISGHNELVKLFLEHGADPNSRAQYGVFPLYLAAYHNKSEVLKTLLQYGADIDQQMVKGYSALHIACFKWQITENCIKILLAAGADVLAEDESDNTPLSFMDLEDTDNPDLVPNIKFMIEALALRGASWPRVEIKDQEYILQSYKYWRYYQDCQAHLSRMKRVKLVSNCSIFDLLTKKSCQIVASIQNPDFRKNFDRCDPKDFSMYAENVLAAFKRLDRYSSAMLDLEEIVNEATHNILPAMITRMVVQYALSETVN